MQQESENESSAIVYKSLHPKKRAFLAAYARNGNITLSAEIAGVSRQAHYKWLENDQTYAQATEDALNQAIDRMESEADRRAMEGVEEVMVHGGKVVCGEDGQPVVRKKYSDTLLIFRLKALRPEKYADFSYNRIDRNMNLTGGLTNKNIADMNESERLAEARRLLSSLQILPASPVIDAEFAEADGGDGGSLDAGSGSGSPVSSGAVSVDQSTS